MSSSDRKQRVYILSVDKVAAKFSARAEKQSKTRKNNWRVSFQACMTWPQAEFQKACICFKKSISTSGSEKQISVYVRQLRYAEYIRNMKKKENIALMPSSASLSSACQFKSLARTLPSSFHTTGIPCSGGPPPGRSGARK